MVSQLDARKQLSEMKGEYTQPVSVIKAPLRLSAGTFMNITNFTRQCTFKDCKSQTSI